MVKASALERLNTSIDAVFSSSVSFVHFVFTHGHLASSGAFPPGRNEFEWVFAGMLDENVGVGQDADRGPTCGEVGY